MHTKTVIHLFILLMTGIFFSGVHANPPIVPHGLIPTSQAKLVFLTLEPDAFIVSDIRSNRFVELRRKAKEKLIETAEAKQVVVIVTNQRITAYSALTGSWSELRTQANEKPQSIRAEDYAAMVTTNQRLLSFNGASGVWTERDR